MEITAATKTKCYFQAHPDKATSTWEEIEEWFDKQYKKDFGE